MNDTKPENVTHKKCSNCNTMKTMDLFYSNNRLICRDCNNTKRRQKYNDDDEHRQKLIKMSSVFKHNKVIERQKIKEEEQNIIGFDKKQCRYCYDIKQIDRFRHNRLKCRDCERDDPIEKFKRCIRTRIYTCLRYKNKTKHSIEYLGSSSNDYFKWIFNNNNDYGLTNYGSEWHIDHVIPISKFDLDNPQEQLLAFNWRNTMPLSPQANLSKNNKIIQSQIQQHYKKLVEYHVENNLDLPQVFIELFAKYLVAGIPLEPMLSNK